MNLKKPYIDVIINPMPEQWRDSCIGIAESDPKRMRMLSSAIVAGGYQRVLSAQDGTTVLDLMTTVSPDCLVLSNGLPGGVEELLYRIREFSRVPIIVVDQEDRQDDGSYVAKILNKGADDYLVNGQFTGQQLTARIGAILRRRSLAAANEHTPPPVFKNDDLTIDYVQHLVRLQDRELSLTPVEYKLLTHFARYVGRPIVHGYTLTTVWGLGYEDDPNCLRVNITRLRVKLGENARNPHYILTERGAGYKMPSYEITTNP